MISGPLNLISKFLFGWVEVVRLSEGPCSRPYLEREDKFTLVPSRVDVC